VKTVGSSKMVKINIELLYLNQFLTFHLPISWSCLHRKMFCLFYTHTIWD